MTDSDHERDEDDVAAATEPVLGLEDAARRAGMSPSTLRRQLAAGTVPGAFRGVRNAWRIPASALPVLAAATAPAETVPRSDTVPAAVPADTGAPAPAAVADAGPADGDIAKLLREVGALRADVRRLQREWDEARVTLVEIREGTLAIATTRPDPPHVELGEDLIEDGGATEDGTDAPADGPARDDLLPEPRKWWDRR